MRLLPLLAIVVSPFVLSTCNKGEPIPKIVKNELVKVGNEYRVKGAIHNPSKQPMQDVKVRYLVWGKLIGKDINAYGSITDREGGEAIAEINYLPPGSIVEFTAIGTAQPIPVYTEGDPDPLVPEVAAKWAK